MNEVRMGTGPARDGKMEGDRKGEGKGKQWEKGGAVCVGWVEESARRGTPERTRHWPWMAAGFDGAARRK